MGRGIVRMLLAAALWVAGPAIAVESAAPSAVDEARIRAVIERQLDAFRHDDGATAYAQAAPGVQKVFATVDIFMAMVRRDYAAVYRAERVVFGPLGHSDGVTAQPVYLIGPDGVPVVAVYVMERQPDGDWRIAGCQLLAVGGKAT